MEHTLRRQKQYFRQLDMALALPVTEGATETVQKAANWYTARQPLQGHQPRRAKLIELACDITQDQGALFWRVTGWYETWKQVNDEPHA